jgi:CRISPR/Cas system CSM-associated protein Csm3 (group 7 of RAMP superfamily)
LLEINYTIALASPMRIATGIGQAGLDNTAVRNAAREAIVPGSSVKGKTRATAMRLAQAFSLPTHDPAAEASGCLISAQPCIICRIFGSAGFPGQLAFDDATLHHDFRAVLKTLDEAAPLAGSARQRAGEAFGRQVRTTTALNRRQGIALDQHLFTQEAIMVPAFCGRISGEIRPAAGGHSGAEQVAALLLAALNTITHLGGARGRGLGRCQIEITSATLGGQAVTLPTLSQYLGGDGPS